MIRLALALLPLNAGCFMMQLIQPIMATSAGSWLETEPVRRDAGDLSLLTRDLAIRQGYKVSDFRPGEGFETEWDAHLSPHWRDGFRTKLEVIFQKRSDGALVVRVRSHREFNENGRQPMLLDKAEWMGATIDEKQSQLINEPAMKLRMSLNLNFSRPNE